MLRKLKIYMKGYTGYAVWSALFISVEVVCELLMPLMMAKIVDKGIPANNLSYISIVGALMILIALIGMFCGTRNAKYSSIASQGYAAALRKDLFHKITGFSFHNIDTFSTASLITRTTTDVTAIQNTVMMGLRILIRAPMMLLCALALAISISPKLSSILLVAVPVLFIGAAVILRKANALFRKMQKRIDALNNTVQENLIGIRVVKAFVREDHEKAKFKVSNDNLMETAIQASSLVVVAMPLMMLVFNFAAIALIWFGGNMVGNGQMEVGTLMSFISYMMQILMSLMMVSMVFLMVARARACGQRIIEVLETEIDITSHAGNSGAPQGGRVEFQDVSFRYGAGGAGDEILSHLSFTVEPGEFVAVVGGTGSGKSTLTSLIPRLYDVSSGRVLVDGVDVRDYDLKALRDSIGVVLQNNTLFSGTIRENLLWGNADATQEELEAACRAAQAHDFILNQPKGYDTDLGQGGVNLSGGQKQRLCIARAMLKKPRILILDDSTSAVDTATEAGIRKAFREELTGTTVLMVAQRISSVEDADKIIVLDDGKISGAGTHGELLASNEIYREINATQQKGVL